MSLVARTFTLSMDVSIMTVLSISLPECNSATEAWKTKSGNDKEKQLNVDSRNKVI